MGYKTYTCPIARECGGCEWLAVPYPIQLRRKQEQVEGLLGEMARADGGSLEAIRGMDEPLRYRHKAATPFAHAARGRVLSGFYAAGTHRIVPCADCLAEDARARRILNAVARVAERMHIPPYDEDRGTGVLRHAVVRCGYATDDVMLVLVTRVDELRDRKRLVGELRSACPEVTTIVQNVNDRRTNAILGRRCHTLFGPGVMYDELLGCRFEIGPTSFYQTNPRQTEELYRLAIEGIADGENVLDAYSERARLASVPRRGAARHGSRALSGSRAPWHVRAGTPRPTAWRSDAASLLETPPSGWRARARRAALIRSSWTRRGRGALPSSYMV